MNKTCPMRLAQISDCHLQADPLASGRSCIPLPRLEAVIEAVNAERPDRVVITGDISGDETAVSYRLAVDTLARLTAPWSWLPGNHDLPALMVEYYELPGLLDLGRWRALLLDTHVDGEAHGELGSRRLARLAEDLEADDRPTLLLMHHPPVPVGTPWLDEIGLADREAFWEKLASYPQVRAILCGHVHQAIAVRYAMGEGEVLVYACPATADQFLPGAATFALDTVARPGYRIVDLGGDTLVSRVERVDPRGSAPR
jgi:Icc protein